MQTGEVLAGKYRLTRRLGKGGEGSVYLAVHLQTEMFWAIKEIPWKEEETDGAVCHELQMMKQLKNRHLPQIIDVLRQGESVFLVMEHVRGIPMDRRLKRDQVLSFREVRDVAEQVTETLCYLESRPRPVCHLDIKPSNLILQPDGLIRLVDFGSAWKEKEQRKRTGTDGYAAPEQYREDSPEPDVRTDIYGLGATLYRMVTGRIWSEASREEGIPDCPAEWSGLILKCLREDPDQRYQSAALLRDAMGRLRKKEKRERGRRQFLAALAMAFPSAALCISILPSTIDLSADESWNYEKLISEAAVVSAEESYSFYRRAVFLEPDRSDAYLHFLSDAQMDGDLSEEEEIFLRDMLHTVRPGTESTYEELLAAKPSAYLETALEIALAYWYSSSREDSRRIALGWFDKALEAGENLEEDSGQDLPGRGDDSGREKAEEQKREAELYCALGKALEKIRSPKENGGPSGALEYWENLNRILEAQKNGSGLKEPFTRLRFIKESLDTITFLAADLGRSGISKEEINRRIRELTDMAERVKVSASPGRMRDEMLEEIRGSGETALEAADHGTIHRTSGGEG